MTNNENIITEFHPWEPFIPQGAEVLIMGTFPPPRQRWSMDFYYPNPLNDFWRIMSLIFLGDKDALYDSKTKKFDVEGVKNLAARHRMALNDTGHEIRRLKGNASDKFLEIVQPVDLHALLEKMPFCRDIATTGEKAAQVVASVTGTEMPRMGEYVGWGDMKIWRMPSTSRAYPMKLEDKAEYYRRLFRSIPVS